MISTFIPAPYPDEIAGSWIARAPLYFGRFLWKEALHACGYGRSPPRIFDKFDYDDRTAKLLELLGTSYEAALLDLTTLPYWLTFHADWADDSRLKGTVAIPPLLATGRTATTRIRSLSRLGRVHDSKGQGLAPRFCPDCLMDDLAVHGEPYWHRSHQLPNVQVCVKHQCFLLHRCPRCFSGQVHIADRFFGGTPRLKCECGQDLSRRTARLKPNSTAAVLASFSADMMEIGIPGWDGMQVRTFFQQSIGDGTREGFQCIYQESISRAYGLALPEPTSAHLLPRRLTKGCELQIELGRWWCYAQAPEFSALAVALGMDLPTVVQGLMEASPSTEGELTLEGARLEVLRKGTGPGRSERAYQMVRLVDPGWIDTNFPRGTKYRRPLPTIQDDRATIEKHIDAASKSLYSSPACMRAGMRDSAWLSMEKVKARKKRTAPKVSSARSESRVALTRAYLSNVIIHGIERTPVTYAELTKIVGVSGTQVGRMIQANPGLRAEMERTNDYLRSLSPYSTERTSVYFHPPESRRHLIKLVHTGSSIPEAARALGITRNTAASWLSDFDHWKDQNTILNAAPQRLHASRRKPYR